MTFPLTSLGAPVAFCSWHNATEPMRRGLLNWVRNMQPERDGEQGDGLNGARAWLDEKISCSTPGGLYQTFIGTIDGEVVWTGSVVGDDRDMRTQIARPGIHIDAFFGLFNSRSDMGGRGIGWAGAQYVTQQVWEGEYSDKKISVALFTTNVAAERHYKSLGFGYVDTIPVPGLAQPKRLYIRRG